MNAFDSIAPPDKADSAAVTAPLVAFLEALHLPAGHRAELTLTLGDVEWRAIRRQFQRPYQKVPQSEFALYLPMGVVWVQRKEEADGSGAERETHNGNGSVRPVACAHCGSPVVWVHGGWVCAGCAPSEMRSEAIRAWSARLDSVLETARCPYCGLTADDPGACHVKTTAPPRQPMLCIAVAGCRRGYGHEGQHEDETGQVLDGPVKLHIPAPLAGPDMVEREATRVTESEYGGVWTAPEGS